MKKIALITLMVIFSATSFAQKDKTKIEGSIAGFFNGMSLVNADTLRFYATPDFQLLENGEVWNLDTLISKVMPRKDSRIQRVNTFEFIRTEQTGDIAWVTYHNSAEFSLGEKKQTVKWMESAVLVKDKGRWKLQMLHSTKLK
jgi:hypothetical protein